MLEITRLMDAPPPVVFKAWTDPEQMRRWWGPNGFTTPVCTIDLRPGGAWHLCMRSPEGQEYWCKGTYREIIEGERIVCTDSFSDESGAIVPPEEYGMSADWPTETLLTVTFAAQGGKTNLTLRHSVPHELIQASGAEQGWSESLDRLAEHVSKPALCPGMAEPQAEHQWLQRMVGEWTSEAEAVMEPGAPPATFTGTESVRSLGGLWVIGEGSGDMPGGGAMQTVITFGYDPQKGKYVGSFVGSMMTHLWLYEGSLDAAGKLVLDTEGPDFAAGGKMGKFQDVVEFVDDDHRVMRSHRRDDNGAWQQFMIAHYRRKA